MFIVMPSLSCQTTGAGTGVGICLLEGNTKWVVIIGRDGTREAVRMVGQGDCALDESTYSGMDRMLDRGTEIWKSWALVFLRLQIPMEIEAPLLCVSSARKGACHPLRTQEQEAPGLKMETFLSHYS